MAKLAFLDIKYWIIILSIFIFSSCKSSQKSDFSVRSNRQDSGKIAATRLTVITLAREQVGKKYQRSSKGPKTFDCSGLVHYVFNRMEMPMAASAMDQCNSGKKIELDEAQDGDLIFFGGKDNITHVGIITVNKKNQLMMVHSSSSRGVIEENVLESDYWLRRMKYITKLTSYKKEKDISLKN
jgi:cell wall-associated NlpC family hydrolase